MVSTIEMYHYDYNNYLVDILELHYSLFQTSQIPLTIKKSISLIKPMILHTCPCTLVKYSFLNSGSNIFIHEGPNNPAPNLLDHSLTSATDFLSSMGCDTLDPESSMDRLGFLVSGGSQLL